MLEIKQWAEIQDHFSDGLLLGNGASIGLHPGFKYGSLFDAARISGVLSANAASVFDKFETTDFEAVLYRLWHAKLVNEALELPHGPVEEAYESVRHSLVATVREIHISHEAALPHLPHIYKFMQGFNTVISINYDLIVYWAAMFSQDEIGLWFKDCFNQGRFRDDWQAMREPYGKATGSTLFFYPHGNLALVRNLADEEIKIANNGGSLIDVIIDRWNSGRMTPLFVCEGDSNQKKASIGRSSYLHRVFREVISEKKESLVIYGWGIGDHDSHILEQLRKAEIDRVAISVHGGNQDYALHAQRKLEDINIGEIVFFDAASQGCWHNPST